MRKASVGASCAALAIIALASFGLALPRSGGAVRSVSTLAAPAPQQQPTTPAPSSATGDSFMKLAGTATSTATPTPTATVTPTPKPTATPLPPVTRGEDLRCGARVIKSIKLEFSITDCAGDGIVIGANDITIDLNGYTVDGADGPHSAGVRNPRGYKNVNVIDGLIQQFEDGVRIEGSAAAQNTLDSLELEHNRTGIVLTKARSNTVRRNELTSNDVGMEIGSDSNTIFDNDITDSRPGIKLSGNSNTIDDNTIDGGGDGLTGAGDKNTIRRNDFRGGLGAGITLTGATNVLDSNDVREFGSVGIWLKQNDSSSAKKNTLVDNDVARNGHDGILVDSTDSILDSNGASHNSGDGIAIRGENALVKDNDAHGNGGYGIRGGKGTRGTGNMASANGSTDCSPAALCD